MTSIAKQDLLKKNSHKKECYENDYGSFENGEYAFNIVLKVNHCNKFHFFQLIKFNLGKTDLYSI